MGMVSKDSWPMVTSWRGDEGPGDFEEAPFLGFWESFGSKMRSPPVISL